MVREVFEYTYPLFGCHGLHLEISDLTLQAEAYGGVTSERGLAPDYRYSRWKLSVSVVCFVLEDRQEERSAIPRKRR